MTDLTVPPSQSQSDIIEDLNTLNQIAETLNRSVDVRSALERALGRLVESMGLRTGWIFISDPDAQDRWAGQGFRLAAHLNLPPALEVDSVDAWCMNCDCQRFCNMGKLDEAYNEVRCSRLASVTGDRGGLTVHASTPLQSAGNVLGILNVAASDWSAFSPRALALLTNVGNQMGAALERTRLFDLLQEKRIHEQATLLGLSNQLLGRMDLSDLTDWLVEEVRRLMGVDACALLLPDADDPEQLVFRAASGWHTDPVAAHRRVPADDRSGSGQVMGSQEPLWVEDASDHTDHWSADWLEEEGFRGAAIVPLVVDGRTIGTFVIDSRQPRRFDEDELRFLQLMANQAAIALEKARLHEEELRRHRMEHEMSVGRQIQLSMLPSACPFVPGWQFAITYEAARQVAGDFYDYFKLPGEPDWLGLLVADVSDKGVPAALFMALSRTTIRNTALRGRAPAEALVWANRFIREDSQTDMFLSVFYGALNTADGRIIYSNAGHNPPILWRAATGRFEELATDGIVLGVLDDIELLEHELQMEPGDVLVMYTDGVTEAPNFEYEEFGMDRLRTAVADAIIGHNDATADDIGDAVMRAVHTFSGARRQADDLTLFVVRRVEAREQDKGDGDEVE